MQNRSAVAGVLAFLALGVLPGHVAAKTFSYDVVRGKIQQVDRGTATPSDGGSWQGESTTIWTDVEEGDDLVPDLFVQRRKGNLTFNVRQSYDGFEIRTSPTGATNSCSGPLVGDNFATYFQAGVKFGKERGLTSFWVFKPSTPSDDCGMDYSFYMDEDNAKFDHNGVKLGDKRIELEVDASVTYNGAGIGVPFEHEMSYTGKVVLKRS